MNAREKHLQDMHQLTHHEYARHLIAEESDDRWLMRAPRDSGWDDPAQRWKWAMWTEVVCLHGGGILVDGDIEPVVFRFGPKDPIARIHWMGRRKNERQKMMDRLKRVLPPPQGEKAPEPKPERTVGGVRQVGTVASFSAMGLGSDEH